MPRPARRHAPDGRAVPPDWDGLVRDSRRMTGQTDANPSRPRCGRISRGDHTRLVLADRARRGVTFGFSADDRTLTFDGTLFGQRLVTRSEVRRDRTCRSWRTRKAC